MVVVTRDKSEQTDARQAVLTQLMTLAPTEDGRPGVDILLPEDRSFESGYQSAVLDLLVRLGVLIEHPHDRTLRVASVQASYFLVLLRDLLQSDQSLVGDWYSLGMRKDDERETSFYRSVDLLNILDQRRMALQGTPEPLRMVRAAVGVVIQHTANDGEQFLLIYDTAARALQLPGGRYEQRDTNLHQTMLRELSEELGMEPLHEPDDLILEPLDLSDPEPRVSPTFGMLTRTEFQAYLVHFTQRPRLTQCNHYWAEEREVVQGYASDGRPIHAPLLVTYLSRMQARQSTRPHAGESFRHNER